MSAAAAVHLPSEVDDRRSDLREVESEYVAVDLSYSKLRKVPHLGKNSAHDLEKNINVESKRRPKEKSSKSGSLGRSLRQILRRIGNNNGEDDESNRNLRTTDTNKENDEEISRVLANLQSQQIIELNLQNNYLKKIETELSNLINLQKLIIRDCQLTEFPESILKLPILSYVDIGKNLISNLPQCFVDSALKTLILDENKFVMGVPPGLFQNRNIEYLNCSSNTIYQSLSWITMQKDLKIKNIEMHLCSLTNISNLTDLEELKAIDVSANSITSLPHSISNWKKLETLILNTNYIHNICESIGKLQELVYLDLSENNIKELPEEICALTNLHILEINSNHIKRIPDSFNKLKSLKTLNLSNNKIRKLSNSLGGLKLLQVIDLSSNQLDNLCFETIHVLKNLKILNLNNNNITKIPKILNCLENLEELFLQSNSITEIETGLYFDSLIFMNVVGNDLKYIPNSIFESKNLKHFKYHENQDGSNLNSNDMENLKLFVTDEQADVSQLKYPESQTFNSPEIQKNVTILKQKKVSFSMSNGQTKAALLIDSQTTHYYHSNAIIMHMDREISDMLGISIRGGIDSFPINHKDFGIFVASVSPHSDMYSRGIRAFDKIRKIDNKCLSNIKHKKAIEIFKSLPQNFLIEVVPQIGSVLDVAIIEKYSQPLGAMLSHSREIGDFPFGFVCNSDKMIEGIYIIKIIEGSPSDICGNLFIGDRIIAVNGRNLEKVSLTKAMEHFRDLILCDTIQMHVQHSGSPIGYDKIYLMRNEESDPFGLKLIGGTEYPFNINNVEYSGIYVQEVLENSPLYGIAHQIEGSQIIAIDNTSVLGVSRSFTISVLSKCAKVTELTICSGIAQNIIKILNDSSLDDNSSNDSRSTAQKHDRSDANETKNNLESKVDQSYLLNEFSTLTIFPSRQDQL